MRLRILAAALLPALLLLAGCRESPARPPAAGDRHPVPALPDIVLVSIDTLRADAPGYAGNSRARTPNLDRLASEGRVFLQAHAHNVMTLPSHANILTGRYPWEHGVRDNDGFRLDPKWETAATLLHGGGYSTAAFIGAFPLDARFGLDRGFDLYDERYPQGANEYDFRVAERPAPEVVAAARRWFSENAGRRRFLFVHLYDCHSPHVPPPELAAAFASDPYAGEVAGVDAALGPLFEDLRASKSHVLLVVTSDHGEALGDHGEETHGLFAYEATLHVPLILWSPGAIPAARDDSLRRHVDILPTLLDAAAVNAPSGLPGRSLLTAGDAGAASYFEALTASFTRGWAPLRGVLRGREKFIDLPIPELYDLASDPAEESNRFEEKKEAAAALKRLLPSPEAAAPSRASESEQTAARLRSLGYLSGGSAGKKSWGPEDDPKRLVDLDRQLQEIVALYQAGKLRDAVALARSAMKRRPTMPVLYEFLSYLEDQAGETSRAIATLEEARRRAFLDERLTTRLGLLYSQTGKTKEAVALLEPLRSSKNPDVSNALGIALATSGDPARAIEAFRNALRLDPKNAVAWQNIGLTQLHANRPAEAIEAFDKAFAVNDRLPRAWNGRGAALEALGRHAEAIEAWKKAIALDPQQFEAMLNLGVVALEQGQRDLARESLARFLAGAPPSLFAEDLARARRLLREASK
ncbi:MAG TPA: sulfatase-like hydrolase/transferase [Thermoanaerobaculia bacterium]|nr:sulfatase-like hydrolase/transferase [Thermoanaerobaculia bacterium]